MGVSKTLKGLSMEKIFDVYKSKIQILFIIIVLLLFIFLLLLFLFKTEDSATIQGVIASDAKTTIKSQITGFIENIFIKNGAFVKAGDIIFKYSDNSLKSIISDYDYKLQDKINYKNTFQKLIHEVTQLYPLNKENLFNQIVTLDNEIAYYSDLYKKIEQSFLLGGDSKDTLLRTGMQLNKYIYEKKKLELDILYEDRYYDFNLNMLKNYGLFSLTDSETENVLDGINKDINYFLTEKEKYQKLLNDSFLRAPVDGIVNFYDSYYFNETEKNYITENEIICDIYSSSKYFVKALVDDIYLPFIDIDDTVYIEIKAYDYNKFGFIKGTIDQIYTAPIIDDEKKVKYYMDISFEEIDHSLFNGMEVDIKIKIHKEMSLFRYFIKNTLLKDAYEKRTDNTIYFIERKFLN
jgi:hypothetical protein